MSAKHDIETLVRSLKNDDAVDAPDDSIRWAKNLFAMRAAEPKAGRLHRVLALLVSDILPNAPVFGQRSPGHAHARQLLFEAEADVVDLRVEGGKSGSEIRGQILGDGFEGATITLAATDAKFETVADEMSLFDIASVPAGNYTLTIRTPHLEIHAEGIVLEH